KAVFGLIQAGFAHEIGRRGAATSPRLRDAGTVEHRNLGVAFYRTGMLDEAEREFEKALALRGDDVASRFYQALLAIRRGRFRDAATRFKELVEKFGATAETFGNLAYALLRLGRASDALLALQQAESLRTNVPRLALLRGLCELERGDPQAAARALTEYCTRLDRAPPGPVYYHFHALSAAIDGDLDEAKRRTEAGLDAHPDAAPLLALAAVIAERRGDLEEAERLGRRAMEEDPALPQAHKNLGDVAYRRGLHDDALVHYERTVELAPDLGDDVWTKLGNLRFKRKEPAAAVACWRRALELNPHNSVVRTNLDVASNAAG
ncbi:MAG: tetratricopeptide repeat protein, partial [Longimicrobiales bacterium]